MAEVIDKTVEFIKAPCGNEVYVGDSIDATPKNLNGLYRIKVTSVGITEGISHYTGVVSGYSSSVKGLASKIRKVRISKGQDIGCFIE